MQIVLVRHGQTEWSQSGQHTGRTDLPLIAEGRRDAEALRPILAERRFSVVLSSPLLRARETCELAGLGAEMQLEENLREWDYGDYEGLTTPEIRERAPNWKLWRDGCPGGEAPEGVGARADLVLARLGELAERRGGAGGDGDGSARGDAIVFAHGHLLRVLGARWVAQPPDFGARLLLGPGALCTLGYERDTKVIAGWNRT